QLRTSLRCSCEKSEKLGGQTGFGIDTSFTDRPIRSVMVRKQGRYEMRQRFFVGMFCAVFAGAVIALSMPPAGGIQGALDAAYTKYKDLKEGKNADYIPALAK